MQEWQCRVAPSLGGGFAGTPEEVWGTIPYEDTETPTVFFGLYGLPDFYTLWKHKGPKAILWAGSDIRHFINGYWLDDEGENRVDPGPLAWWIRENCDSYVENWVEERALKRYGIESTIIPSFLGNVSDYEVVEYPDVERAYYSSVSGDDFTLYGWDKILEMAELHPKVCFHLYGNKAPFNTGGLENVIVKGRYSQEGMDKEIKKMTGAIRMTEFDGFSEILAKSLLWGQWPISLIRYPHTDESPTSHTGKNLEGAEFYRKIINKYPWNVKNHT